MNVPRKQGPPRPSGSSSGLILPAKKRILLATEPSPPVTDFSKYMLLLYGRESIGKTTLLAGAPDVYFITTEPGTKGMQIHENLVSCWEDILELVAQLEQTDRYSSVVIDTVDLAYDMAQDYTCEKLGIEYPGEDKERKKDFGKSWREIKKQFMAMIHALLRTGRGVRLTSHETSMEMTARSGATWDRIVPSMSKQARQVLAGVLDYAFYCDFVKGADGKTHRVMFTQGDETLYAKSRVGVGAFPPILPMVKDGGYEVLLQGFRGEHPGLDPKTLMPCHETTATKALSRISMSTFNKAKGKETVKKQIPS